VSLSPRDKHKWKCNIKKTYKGVDPPPVQVQLRWVSKKYTPNPIPAKKTLKKTSMNGSTSRSASLIHMKAEPQTSPRKMNLIQFFIDNPMYFDYDLMSYECLSFQAHRTLLCPPLKIPCVS